MSYTDRVFKNMVRNILENGISDEGLQVRPHWEDGTPAHTIQVFGTVNRYDLQKEFPILTLRRTYWKSAWDEVAWIWQKKSNNVRDLSSHVWDEWADENGSIGKAYGYQMTRSGLNSPKFLTRQAPPPVTHSRIRSGSYSRSRRRRKISATYCFAASPIMVLYFSPISE